MPEPDKVTISIHTDIPSPHSEVADAVLRHMRELAVSGREAGWAVSMTVTLTKPRDEAGPGGE